MRRHQPALLACVFCALAAARCAAPAGESIAWSDENAADVAPWRLEQLNLDVRIEPLAGALNVAGDARLRFDGESSPGPVLFVNGRKPVFGFERLTSPTRAAIYLNLTPAEFPRARAARLTLADPAKHGDQVDVRFECRKYTDSFQLVVGPSIALASWVEAWYPSLPPGKDQGLASRMSATGRTRFRVPRGWHVASNGKLLDRRETDDGVVVEYEVNPAVARSFAAAPYHAALHTVGGREVGVYLLSDKPDAAREQAESLGKALAAMEARLGPYPYPSYAIAEIPRFAVSWYASSEQGFIMVRSDAFEYGQNLPLFAHEMAHGWWGNLVNQTGPGSLLCSESLAQYCAVLAIESLEGAEEATRFLRFSRKGYNSQQCAFGYFDMLRRGLDAPLSKLDKQNFAHNLSDAKGHWVYHMLRGRIGDDVFFGVLRGLIRDYAGKQMSLDDVRRAFIAAAPREAELERFFADWLDRGGAPVIDVEWKPAADGAAAVEVVLKQAHAGEPYLLDVELAVQSDAGESRQVVRVAERETRARLAATGKPTGVRIDPDHKLLIWDPQYGRRPE